MRRLWSGGVLEAITHRPVHADVCGRNETDLNHNFAASGHSRDKEGDGQDVSVESAVENRPNAVVLRRVRGQTDVRRQEQPYKQDPVTVNAEEVDVNDSRRAPRRPPDSVFVGPKHSPTKMFERYSPMPRTVVTLSPMRVNQS